jgi:hypothetical protein
MWATLGVLDVVGRLSDGDAFSICVIVKPSADIRDLVQAASHSFLYMAFYFSISRHAQ